MTYRNVLRWLSYWSFKQASLCIFFIIQLCQGYTGPYIGIPTFCVLLPCWSQNYGYTRCILEDDIRIHNATVVFLFSKTRCKFHYGTRDSYDGNDGIYGFENNFIWVDNGCRAMFGICYRPWNPFKLVPLARSTSYKPPALSTVPSSTSDASTQFSIKNYSTAFQTSSRITRITSSLTEQHSDSTTKPSARTMEKLARSMVPSAGTEPPSTFLPSSRITNHSNETKQHTASTMTPLAGMIATPDDPMTTPPGTEPLSTSVGGTAKLFISPKLTRPPFVKAGSLSGSTYLTTVLNPSRMSPLTLAEDIKTLTTDKVPESSVLINNVTGPFGNSEGNETHFSVTGGILIAVVVILGITIIGVAVWRKRHGTRDANI